MDQHIKTVKELLFRKDKEFYFSALKHLTATVGYFREEDEPYVGTFFAIEGMTASIKKYTETGDKEQLIKELTTLDTLTGIINQFIQDPNSPNADPNALVNALIAYVNTISYDGTVTPENSLGLLNLVAIVKNLIAGRQLNPETELGLAQAEATVTSISYNGKEPVNHFVTNMEGSMTIPENNVKFIPPQTNSNTNGENVSGIIKGNNNEKYNP